MNNKRKLFLYVIVCFLVDTSLIIARHRRHSGIQSSRRMHANVYHSNRSYNYRNRRRPVVINSYIPLPLDRIAINNNANINFEIIAENSNSYFLTPTNFDFWGPRRYKFGYWFYPNFKIWYNESAHSWFCPSSNYWFYPKKHFWYWPELDRSIIYSKNTIIIDNSKNTDIYFAVYKRENNQNESYLLQIEAPRLMKLSKCKINLVGRNQGEIIIFADKQTDLKLKLTTAEEKKLISIATNKNKKSKKSKKLNFSALTESDYTKIKKLKNEHDEESISLQNTTNGSNE